MRRVLSLKTFVMVSLLLFLATSYENTRLLAANFHGSNPLLPWAFAGAVELGVIGLSVGIIVRRRNRQPARGYVAILLGVLTLSVTANFLMGAQSFFPEFHIMGKVREWSFWWLLPLAFSAAVPVLIFAFSELLATLVLEERDRSAANTALRPVTASGVSHGKQPSLRSTPQTNTTGELPVLAHDSQRTVGINATPTEAAASGVSSCKQPPLLSEDGSDGVARVVALYGERPETPLAQLARQLEVSPSTASRLRIRGMQQGLLVKLSRGRYSPNAHFKTVVGERMGGDGIRHRAPDVRDGNRAHRGRGGKASARGRSACAHSDAAGGAAAGASHACT